MNWSPYPAYKPSGVEWLGQIPAHWQTLLLKRTANIRYGLGQPPPEMIEGAPLIRATNIKSGHIFDEGMIYVDPAEVPAGRNAVLSEGEIIVVRSGAYTGDSTIIPAKYSSAISGYDLVVTIREGYSPFFAWQFLCPVVRDLQFIPSSLRAAQPHLNAEELGETIIAVPPLPEQCAIAAYLDHETARFDALIAKHQRLIELLQEKRAALINHTVTQGLDPSAPMKDSRVPWLGQIPAHWEVVQLRRVTQFVDYRGATPEKVPSGIPLVTARNIKNGAINLDLAPEFIREEDYDGWMVRGFPEIGDVLVTTEAPLGESAQVTDPKIALAQRIILLKADKCCIANDYLKYHFASDSGKGELWSRATGSTAIGIKASHLRETLITVPPIEEQKAITAHLDRETAQLDALIARVREGIEKLREYRAALISAAVTGKIDVRSA